jgi:hypothetical protein
MKKNQYKINLQLEVRKLSGTKTTKVWYQGITNFYDKYHSVSGAIYLQFDREKVYRFIPGDKLGMRIGYGITIKENTLEHKKWGAEFGRYFIETYF